MNDRRSQDGGDDPVAMIADEAELGASVDPAAAEVVAPAEPLPEPETAPPAPFPVDPQDRAALVEQIRAVDPGTAPQRAAELARIYARLRDLRDRMAEANRRGAR